MGCGVGEGVGGDKMKKRCDACGRFVRPGRIVCAKCDKAQKVENQRLRLALIDALVIDTNGDVDELLHQAMAKAARKEVMRKETRTK